MQISTSVRNIVFDLGGVILDIDPQKTFKALYEMGFPETPDLKSLLGAGTPPVYYETGKIGTEEFREWARTLLRNGVPDCEIDRAWTAMLLQVPPARVNFLKQMALHHRLFLYSNTNELHQRKFEKDFAAQYDFDFKQLFMRVYYSHVLGWKKPDKEGFEIIMKENDLAAQETLFIDDNKENIRTAHSLGMETILLEKGMELSNLTIA